MCPLPSRTHARETLHFSALLARCRGARGASYAFPGMPEYARSMPARGRTQRRVVRFWVPSSRALDDCTARTRPKPTLKAPRKRTPGHPTRALCPSPVLCPTRERCLRYGVAYARHILGVAPSGLPRCRYAALREGAGVGWIVGRGSGITLGLGLSGRLKGSGLRVSSCSLVMLSPVLHVSCRRRSAGHRRASARVALTCYARASHEQYTSIAQHRVSRGLATLCVLFVRAVIP